MNGLAARLIDYVERNVPAILVIVANTKGSVPRETGAWMVVSASDTQFAVGTIGGGHLELKSIEMARAMMANATNVATARQFPLGPALGQCCGGAVEIVFVPIAKSDRTWLSALSEVEQDGGTFVLRRALDTGAILALPLRFDPWLVWVFGAGHVGKAIVDVLGSLPCATTWVDSRDAQFPATLPANATIIETDAAADEVANIPPGADVLVLTHSHALDLDICAALIRRDDLAYIGVIGSETKAATFRKRFEQRGVSGTEIARMMCPIGQRAGQAALKSKHPGVIAVGVAADLIERRQLLALTPNA